ncbi:MAG: CDP-diacylglycerol--glycerol-3-phosphate 3-phosphatidyltransferase [Candidatus Omnitrophota bacterium]
MNLPNKLTVSRFFLTFIFMLLLFAGGLAARVAALFVFIIAILTDWFDGLLARRNNQLTDFGKFMDPIADKVLVLSAFFAFIELDLVPAWMVVLILFRELAITGLRVSALSKHVVIPASEGGKHKTASQMTAIFVVLVFLIFREAAVVMPDFWTRDTEILFNGVILTVMLIATALTLISGFSFIYKNREIFTNAEPDN